jgi:hypothetical protein
MIFDHFGDLWAQIAPFEDKSINQPIYAIFYASTSRQR